jgi:hypothetical protein
MVRYTPTARRSTPRAVVAGSRGRRHDLAARSFSTTQPNLLRRPRLLLTYQPAGRPALAEFDYESALLAEQWMDELP